MKKNRIPAIMIAAVCGLCVRSVPATASASRDEQENRDQVPEQSLILPEDIAYTWDTLNAYLWDKETNTRTMDAFTELDKEQNIIVVADNEDILAGIRAFVREKQLDESLIGYRIERFAEMIPDGYTAETPVTNEELETMVTALQALNTYLNEKGYIDSSAYASLFWGRHSIECFAQSYAVEYDIRQFIAESGIDGNLICIVVAPEADYRVPDGGQRSYEEVNTIVAGEYIALKQYLSDSGILSNIYLTAKGVLDLPQVPYSCIEIYVKSQEDADKLKAYMEENHYWQDVAEITVQPDLSADPDSLIHNKAYICLKGDSNDDGRFAVSDVIKLQKYLLTADTMNEREAIASDFTADGKVDTFDLVLSKRELLNAT